MKRSFWNFLTEQWATIPPVLTTDLTGKTVAVIGANTGIGLEAAKHLASMNPARLILGCRNEQKGLAAVKEIQDKTRYTGSAECWSIDLCNFASVVAFAERFTKDGIPLDMVILNAGIAQTFYETSEDGWEQVLQTNHLGTALLSLLLTPVLAQTAEKNSTESRLVIVTSDVHYWASFPKEVMSAPNIFDKLNDKQYFAKIDGETRYNESKMLNVFFTRAYTERLAESTPLLPSCTSPGFCISEFRRSLSTSTQVFSYVMEKIGAGRTAEEGSRQLIYAALGPDDKNAKWRMKGGYVSTAQVVEPSDFVLSEVGEQAQKRVWDDTIHILSKVAPNLPAIVRQYFTN